MSEKRKTISDAIATMTFGELVDLAADVRDAIGIPWRTYSDEDFTSLDLASALHAWAISQESRDE